jgi:hypothetical protein
MTLVSHQFADTTQETNAGFTTPLWIVGDNPFQEMQREDEGYVVHLAQPMVSPAYAAQRSALAKQLGLGRKPAAAAPSQPPWPARLARARARTCPEMQQIVADGQTANRLATTRIELRNCLDDPSSQAHW